MTEVATQIGEFAWSSGFQPKFTAEPYCFLVGDITTIIGL